MDGLTMALVGLAALAGAAALGTAVAAVAVQCKDRRGANKDVALELWVYASVLGGLSFGMAVDPGPGAGIGARAMLIVAATPLLYFAGWLVRGAIKFARGRLSPETEFERTVQDETLLARLGQAHTRFARPALADPDRLDYPSANGSHVRFAHPPGAPARAATAEPAIDAGEKKIKPSSDALYFRKSRSYAQVGMLSVGLALGFIAFLAGAFAPRLAFPLMELRFDFGALAAALALYGYFRYGFRDFVEQETGTLLAVEARGLHVGPAGSVKAGTAFLPWAAIKDAGFGGKSGDIWLTVMDFYRRPDEYSGYIVIPKPAELEFGKDFFDAVRRLAPEKNPLRRYVENFFVRWWYLYLGETVLAVTLAMTAYLFLSR